MKQNCNNCKALDMVHKKCWLGFSVKPLKTYYGIPLTYKPLEECPKPKTSEEFASMMRMAAMRNRGQL